MNFTLLINSADAGVNTAYQFCIAALAQGHAIKRVFFYGDGIYSAHAFNAPPEDELNLLPTWKKLVKEKNIDLVICVAAALRRGISIEHGNVAEGFRVAGLSELMDAAINSDRFITL